MEIKEFTPNFTQKFAPSVAPGVASGVTPSVAPGVTPQFTPGVTLRFTPTPAPRFTPRFTPRAQTFGALHKFNKQINFNNIETSIDIYKIQVQDFEFIENLKKSINLKALMPKMNESHLNVWNSILQQAFTKGSRKAGTTYLAAVNNKPCGIMTFKEEKNCLFLDTICTWPVEKEKRAPFAGKALMQTMFQDFMQSKHNMIDLYAIKNGPFNAVSKYLSLGFKPRGGENDIEVMRAQKPDIVKTLAALEKFIKTTPVNEEKNLFEVTNTKML